MGRPSQAPIGSRWKFKTETRGRIFVVTGRKPGGVVEIKQEDRACFGQAYLANFLACADRISDDHQPEMPQSDD